MGKQLNVDERGYERKPHGKADFPASTSYSKISRFEGGHFRHHWHREPEFTVIDKGEMDYQVNGCIYHLTAGQGIYVNSNMIHSGWNERGECCYMPINFDPWYFFSYNNNCIWTKYIEPILTSQSLTCIVFDPQKSETDKQIVEVLKNIYELFRSRPECYEIKIVQLLYEAIMLMTPIATNLIGDKKEIKQVTRIKSVIDFIEEHYAEPITIDYLASVCNLSYSEFCRSFKAIMQQTPTEYLTRVRLRKSLPLLSDGEHTVTEAAELCGFSGPSYFAETFKRYMFVTPKAYAKRMQNSKG